MKFSILFLFLVAFASAQVAPGVGAPGVSAGATAGGGGGGDGTVTEVTGGNTGTARVSVANGTTTPEITVDFIPPSVTGNSLISGGAVGYVSGLNVTVGAAEYIIQGVSETSPLTNLTAAAADPTNPRFDVVYLDSSGVAGILTGTAAATPVVPQTDPDTQLYLTHYLLAANATSIPVTIEDIYYENTEWTMTKVGAPINLASTSNPYAGTTDIEATAAVAGNSFTATVPAAGTFDPGTFNTLFFYIRNKASWSNSKSISIQLMRSGAVRGQLITFKGNTFGFNSQNQFTTYQQIAIPTSNFGANGITCDAIRFTVTGGGGSIGFYVDDITLQTGISPFETSTKMQWQGNFNIAKAYNLNDVVLSSGIQYVAIQAGVGHTPASSTTYWQPSSAAGSSGTVTASGPPTSGQWAKWTSATDITGITPGAGVETFAVTPSGANLAAALTSDIPGTSIADTAVTPGTYTYTTLTVDQQGRITAASSGSNVSNIGSQTIWIPAMAMTPAVTNGSSFPGFTQTTATRPDIVAAEFDPTTRQYAQFGIAMPKSWNAGTVTAQFLWAHPATTVNFGVTWALQAVAVADDDTLDVVYGTAQIAADTGGTTNDLYISAYTPAINVASTPTNTDYVSFQVYRDTADGGDNMAVNARLIGIRLIYTTNAANDD